MSDTRTATEAPPPAIPQNVVDRYVLAFPHLHTLATQIPVPVVGGVAAKTFARACCRLTVPSGVTLKEVWHLAGVAEGRSWPES